MTLKTLLLGTACSAFTCSLFAQDIINKRNGDSDKAKILEISTKTISYKMWDNPDGPTMILPVREVKTIEFQNGQIQKIGRDDMLHDVRRSRVENTTRNSTLEKYGNTIIAASPIYMTNTSVVGLGLSLEHIMDKNDYISLYLPVGLSFTNPSSSNKSSTMFWAYPGIKYYPTGNNGIARFAMGPSIVFGAGTEQRREDVYDSRTQTFEFKEFTNNVFLMGIMLNHSLNLQPTPHLYLGMEFGIGFPYFVSESENSIRSTYNTFDNGAPLVQFQFKVGYRL